MDLKARHLDCIDLCLDCSTLAADHKNKAQYENMWNVV